MSDIRHDFPVSAARPKVFAAVATPRGLDQWWTFSSKGVAEPGAEWEFFFDQKYDWRGKVTRLEPDRLIEWEITRADADWRSTLVTIELSDRADGLTWVKFAHTGWRDAGEHFRITSYCWAMYLRVLKNWLQRGEVVPYDERLEV